MAARIEWSRIDQPKTPSDKQRESFHTTRYSGLDQLYINHGDHEGLVFPERIGQDLAYSEIRMLKKENEQWFHAGDTPSVSVATSDAGKHPVFDVRTLGMVPAVRNRA